MTTDSSRPLGEWLQQRREERGISLEQAEADTRIRLRYLEALESDQFDALPDPVVGRGFLRNYAVYLELDPKEASDRYSALVAPPQPESLSVEGPTPFTEEPFRPMALHEMPVRRFRWLWIVALILVLVVALALLAWWQYPLAVQWLAQQRPANTPLSASPTQQATEADLPTATRTTAVTPARSTATAAQAETTPTLELTLTPTWTPSPSPSPSPPVYTGIFLELVFTDTSWIQVTVDGVREFQGELETDTYRSWYGEDRIELRVGNAGSVLVTVNGQLLGTLGASGEVVDRVFEKVDDGVVEATVTNTPTAAGTISPTASPSVTPSRVPPTVTPSRVPPTVTPSTAPPTATIAPTVSVTPTATLTPTLTLTPTASP